MDRVLQIVREAPASQSADKAFRVMVTGAHAQTASSAKACKACKQAKLIQGSIALKCSRSVLPWAICWEVCLDALCRVLPERC